jgi:hypothetical protein
MMETPPVSSILRNQQEDTGLDESAVKNLGVEAARSGYFPKYTGAIWRALFLAQVGAEPGNPGVRDLCEHPLRNTFDGRMGAFGFRLEWKMGAEDAMMPCFIARATSSLSTKSSTTAGSMRRMIGLTGGGGRGAGGDTPATGESPRC